MSAGARKKANAAQADARVRYTAAVMEALQSNDEPYRDGTLFRVVPCPNCGRLLLSSCRCRPRRRY